MTENIVENAIENTIENTIKSTIENTIESTVENTIFADLEKLTKKKYEFSVTNHDSSTADLLNVITIYGEGNSFSIFCSLNTRLFKAKEISYKLDSTSRFEYFNFKNFIISNPQCRDNSIFTILPCFEPTKLNYTINFQEKIVEETKDKSITYNIYVKTPSSERFSGNALRTIIDFMSKLNSLKNKLEGTKGNKSNISIYSLIPKDKNILILFNENRTIAAVLASLGTPEMIDDIDNL